MGRLIIIRHNAPRRILAEAPGLIKANKVTSRILHPGFPPKPAHVLVTPSHMSIAKFRSDHAKELKVVFKSLGLFLKGIELIGGETGNNIVVRSKGIEGEATLGIYSLKSGMQIRKVLIKILPRDVALN